MNNNKNYTDAVRQIKQAILKSQYQAAKGVNTIQLSLYYGIGRYVSENTRKGAWGTDAIATISKQLQCELPGLRGFGERNIKNMRQFYEAWSNIKAVSADISAKTANDVAVDDIDSTVFVSLKSADASAEIEIREFCSIGFSHHLEIIKYAATIEERKFYIHLAAIKHCNVLDLRDMLRADIFHHQGTLPNNFLNAIPIRSDALNAVSMFRDEYFLDFINLDDINAEDAADVDERVVEKAIVGDIKKFIVGLGSSFCFIGNQYRVEVGGDEFFIDLLFYNRDLKSLVAIELKRGEFKPSYLGQLNFYLNILDDKERREGENPAIGLILCKDMNRTVVELAVRSYNNPMGVAIYRLPGDVPEEYKVMRPIMEHAQWLLAGNEKEDKE